MPDEKKRPPSAERQENWSSVYKTVAKGLDGPYLLVFGIALLVFIGAGVAAALGQQTTEWLAVAGMAFLTAIVVVYLVHGKVVSDPPPTSDQGVEEPAEMTEPVSENLRKVVERLSTCATRYEHPVFAEMIDKEQGNWLDRAELWAKGEDLAAADEYNWILLRYYENARVNVFSTSLPEYLETWEREFGDLILKTHEKAGVTVTRVFVFDRAEDVGDEEKRILKKHAAVRQIRNLIYFDADDEALYFTDFGKDFTVIDDGLAVGITQQFGESQLQARWIHRPINEDSPRTIIRALEIRDRLLGLSQNLDDWLKRS